MEKKGIITRRTFVTGTTATLVLAGLGALPGCATNASNDGSGQATEGAVRKGYAVNADVRESLTVGAPGKDIKIACIVVANQLGLYEEENLDVAFETIANLSDGITAVSENRLDILPFGVIPTCTFVGQGVENVVVIGGTIAEGSEVLALPENKDAFKKPEDFKGKRIGYYPMETGHIVMQGLIADAGIDNGSECEWIIQDSSASTMEGVRKGELDCGFVNSGYGYVAQKAGVEVALKVGDLSPNFPCCRQTTNFQCIEEKASALVKFEIANLRAYDILQHDRSKAIKAIMEYSGQDEAYVEAVIYGTDAYDAAMVVEMDPYFDAVCDFYEVMKQTGNIPAENDYRMEDHVEVGIYHAALDEMIARGENPDWYAQVSDEFKTHNVKA